MYRASRLNAGVLIALRNFRILADSIIRSCHARQARRRRVRVDIEGL
jgi:hypothetical protein